MRTFPANVEDINIDFYNTHAREWHELVKGIKETDKCDAFLKYLPEKAHILDLGCGNGCETKYFLEKGYDVTAMDGSRELVNYAREHTNHPIHHMRFDELHVLDEFDGIWACASLLHLSQERLLIILEKNILPALRESGIFFLSFRYGEGESEHQGRYFYDYHEESFKALMKKVDRLQLKELWKTERTKENGFEFLNGILQKTR